MITLFGASLYQALQEVECAEPDVGQLLRKMVSMQPTDRPSTTQLIKAFKQIRASQIVTMATAYQYHFEYVSFRKKLRLSERWQPWCCRENLKRPIHVLWSTTTLQIDIQVQEAQIPEGTAVATYLNMRNLRLNHNLIQKSDLLSYLHYSTRDAVGLHSDTAPRPTGIEPV